MTYISTHAKPLAVNEGSAESVSLRTLEPRKDTSSTPAVQVPRYRHAKRGTQGQVVWVQGAALAPVATPSQMAHNAKEHARSEWRRQFAFPSDYRPRTPEEHRAAVAALDAIEAPEKSVADIAREIADSWVK